MRVTIGALVVLVGNLTSVAAQPVTYEVRYQEPGATSVEVAINLPGLQRGPRELVMPRAIPMGYGEAPYDEFVETVRALAGDGRALDVTRLEGPRWRIGSSTTAVTRIEYSVDVKRMEREIVAASDASRVRDGYVSLLGYSVFGFVDGLEDRAVELQVKGPAGWPVLTTLDPSSPKGAGSLPSSRTVAAPSFYALADSQLVMGPRVVTRRPLAPVPLTVVLFAEISVDIEATVAAAATAFERVVDYFGGAPFPHYTVLVEYLEPLSPRHRYGFSMEHLDSSTFYLSGDGAISTSSSEADRLRVTYNFAHHVAHAWIPKRAFGEGYYPFTWELAPVIDTIWFSEGFGQYAAVEAMAAGETDPGAYRQRLLDRRFRAALADMPPLLRGMPLVELSRIASTRYSSDFRTGRTSFARGALMAAEMDDRMRQQTAGRKQLRDALRHLVAWSTRERRAFRIGEIPAIFREATGVETRDILERWIGPLPER